MTETIVKIVRIKGAKRIDEANSGDWNWSQPYYSSNNNSESLLSFDNEIMETKINNIINNIENEGFEIENIFPTSGVYSNTLLEIASSLTTAILIVGKKPIFHYSKGVFTFEEDRLRFTKNYLKMFTFFKEHNIKVNLICNNGDIQKNILQNKNINKNNMEITALSNIKDNLQNLSNKKIKFKIICVGDREYNLILNA